MPQNWDCLCIPTIADDVVINLANIPGQPRIGAVPGFARSLTVGGNSNTPQSLYIQNALTVGVGGVSIPPNGYITLDSATGTPLTSAGPVNGLTRFLFNSGTLAGAGPFNFQNVNFTGPALKVINTTAVVTGLLLVNPGPAGQGVINIQGGQLQIATGATLRSSESLTLTSMTGGSLNAQGVVMFLGGATNVFTLRGPAMIASLSLTGGTTTISDNVTVTSANVQTGAIINLIGVTESQRNFGDITGAGTVQVQGGTNVFTKMTNIGTVLLQGGVLQGNANPLTIGTLEQTSGILNGKATVSINTATFSNADIVNSPVTVTGVTFKGPTTLDGAILTVVTTAVIATDSQLTLSDGAQFVISSTGQVSQSAPLSIVPSSQVHPPIFTNNGQWTSTSKLTLVVGTKGTGSFQLGTGSTTVLSGIAFNAGSLTLTSSFFSAVGSVVNVGSISGTGTIDTNGEQFIVTGALAASNVTLENGVVQCGSANINLLDGRSGTFNITGPSAVVSSLTWEGGLITCPPAAGTTLTVTSLTLTGTQPKTLINVKAVVTNLSLTCGTQQCQLFTLSASLTTKTQMGLYSLKRTVL